jgi:hypothetical protein
VLFVASPAQAELIRFATPLIAAQNPVYSSPALPDHTLVAIAPNAVVFGTQQDVTIDSSEETAAVMADPAASIVSGTALSGPRCAACGRAPVSLRASSSRSVSPCAALAARG